VLLSLRSCFRFAPPPSHLLNSGGPEGGTLLLLDHSDGVDKDGRENTRSDGGGHSDLPALAENVGDSKEETKLGNALESNTDEAGTETGEGSTDGGPLENRVGLSPRDGRIDSLACSVLR